MTTEPELMLHGHMRHYLSNGTPPGTELDARMAWQAEERTARSWDAIKRALRDTYAAPAGVDAAAIRQAATLLGLTLPEESAPEEMPHG